MNKQIRANLIFRFPDLCRQLLFIYFLLCCLVTKLKKEEKNCTESCMYLPREEEEVI